MTNVQVSIGLPVTCTSGNLVFRLFRAQPEHAIRKSRPAGTAKYYPSPGNAECPSNVRITTDKDSRDSERDTGRHTQAAIHSPQVQNHVTVPPLSGVLDRKYYQFNVVRIRSDADTQR